MLEVVGVTVGVVLSFTTPEVGVVLTLTTPEVGVVLAAELLYSELGLNTLPAREGVQETEAKGLKLADGVRPCVEEGESKPARR